MDFVHRMRRREDRRNTTMRSRIAPTPTTESTAAMTEEAKSRQLAPLDDDVCPICFGDFTIPCRTDCAHWFCGSCILRLWNHGSALEPCKCPLCCCYIKTLTPMLSMQQHEEAEARQVLKNVQRYNRLYVGGVYGIIQRVSEIPLLLGRVLKEMMDPDREDQIDRWRLISIVLGFVYSLSPFKFIPAGVNVPGLINLFAAVLVVLLRLVGLYRRHLSAQRVRQQAAFETNML